MTRYDEIRVYDGVAERTGAQFDRSEVGRSGGSCKSLAALVRKARMNGDGTFYLPIGVWPADTERVDLKTPWVGMSTVPMADDESK